MGRGGAGGVGGPISSLALAVQREVQGESVCVERLLLGRRYPDRGSYYMM